MILFIAILSLGNASGQMEILWPVYFLKWRGQRNQWLSISLSIWNLAKKFLANIVKPQIVSISELNLFGAQDIFSIMVTSPPHPHTAFFYLYPFLKNLLSITKTLSLTIIESNIRAYINIEYFLKNIGHKTFCTHTYIRTYKSIHGTNKKNGGPYRRSVYNINSYGVISIH